MQYLYDSGDEVVFMDEETYEQLSLPRAPSRTSCRSCSRRRRCRCCSSTTAGRASSCPSSVVLEVTETEPGVKGDTVSNVTKPATLETGAVVQVPLFVNVGDKIKVDPREKRYISRA